jgi:hypothetical protein
MSSGLSTFTSRQIVRLSGFKQRLMCNSGRDTSDIDHGNHRRAQNTLLNRVGRRKAIRMTWEE